MKEEFILAEVDLAETVTLPVRRRPECYGVLSQPTESLPVTRLIEQPILPTTTRVGALQLRPYASPDDLFARVKAQSRTLVRQGAALVLLPGIPTAHTNAPSYQAEQMLAPLQALSQDLECGLVCPLITAGEGSAAAARSMCSRRRGHWRLSSGACAG